LEVVSVNVGIPREVAWKGMRVETGIFKDPVDGPVAVGKLNLAGDRQADLTVHGGPEKAVYAYPSEHYQFWKEQLPKVSFAWGKFGENLTTSGLSEESLFIGDCLKVGSAVLVVTQPRLPCYKLALKFNRDDMIKRFLVSERSGFYFSVVQEGEVSAHSPIEVLNRDPNRVSVADISRLYFSKEPNRALLRRVANLGALPQSWKEDLVLREQGRR
jgi:MOSC domain-containing protein YiiM